jgi:hypothetical protein
MKIFSYNIETGKSNSFIETEYKYMGAEEFLKWINSAYAWSKLRFYHIS